MAEIKLKNLTKRWGNFIGVDDFNRWFGRRY